MTDVPALTPEPWAEVNAHRARHSFVITAMGPGATLPRHFLPW